MFLSLIATLSIVSPQGQSPIDLTLAERYFQEAKWISDDDAGKLWGQPIYGRLLFVDPSTRAMVANMEPPETGFSKVGSVFTGTLPPQIGIANYSFAWKNQLWSMVMWPLPENRAERSTLVIHELFHKIQPALGIPQASPKNAQMETYDGRLWLQIELRALSEALYATDQKERERAGGKALLFRQMRYRKFPDAKKEEDALELNEGLAQYTGYMLRGGWEPESRLWLANQLRTAVGLDTYARRFAYFTGTAYAFLLNVAEANRFDEVRWRKQIKPDMSLADTYAKTIGADLSTGEKEIIELAKPYGYENLQISEGIRDRERQARRQEIIKAYVDGPILEFPMVKMNISFNPSTVFPMNSEGTFYPTATLINEWGTLEVSDGVLISSDFKSAIVKAPKSAGDLSGPGWKLTLSPGWKIAPGSKPGSFRLVKA
ncbi:MAG TPA: hypothetical protein VJ835_11685 [Fimbriimonadaceae bacterium]|nr:hypothetical protein [Fimbriimonadaceae bacterium]